LAQAKDEKCELLNYDMSRLPMPRTKDGFISQSHQIGLAKMTRRTIEDFYTIRPLRAKKPPRSASKKVDKPQKSIIYELLAAMDTGAINPNRTFTAKSLSDMTKTMKTNLKLKSVEGRMEKKREYENDHILSTLKQVTMDRTTTSTRGMNEEDREVIELEEDLELEEPVDEDAVLLEENTVELDVLEMDETDVEVSTEKGYNVNCVCDIWARGKELLMRDDVKNSRNNEHGR
jgi:hypothetical protein